VGLLNAVTSLATVVGSALAGVIFGDAGFTGLAAAAIMVAGSASVVTALWSREWKAAGGRR
jgi:hypothetical protein